MRDKHGPYLQAHTSCVKGSVAMKTVGGERGAGGGEGGREGHQVLDIKQNKKQQRARMTRWGTRMTHSPGTPLPRDECHQHHPNDTHTRATCLHESRTKPALSHSPLSVASRS